MSALASPINLVWHRTDLRLCDNAAMTAAVAASQGLTAGVFVLPADPYEVAVLSRKRGAVGSSGSVSRAALLGAPPEVARSSPRRIGFLLQAIEELRAEWRARGSTLFILRGNAAECVSTLAAELGVREVHTAPCPSFDELNENTSAERILNTRGAKLVVHDETTLFAAEDLPFVIDQLPDVFSNFRRVVEKHCRVRSPLTVPDISEIPREIRTLANEQADAILAASVFVEARQRTATPDPRASFVAHGGRSHGLTRIRKWFWEKDCLARYKETRDGLVGENFSSRLSPWLALGTISPREVAAEIRRYESERVANDSTYWLFFELLWRDFFHLWVRRWQGRAFKATGVLGRTPCGSQDREAFLRWCEGTTGEPFIDASMRELRATGQLSNRARQNVASWLARTQGIDWRWGAAWFESQLIDFDVGPNWGNWQYVAGVGNDPRNRVFNVRDQAERYDADGAYRALWAGK